MLPIERQLTPDDRAVVWVLLRPCRELVDPLLICGNCMQDMGPEVQRVCGFCRGGFHETCIVTDRSRPYDRDNDGRREYDSYWCCAGCLRSD